MTLHRRWTVLLVLVLMGCLSMEKVDKSPHARIARAYLDSAGAGHVSYLTAQLAPSLQAIQGVDDSVRAILTFLPGVPWDTVRLIGFHINGFNSERTSNLSFELHGTNGWGLANITVAEDSGPPVVSGFHAYRIPRSLESENAFTLSGRPLQNYVILILAVGALAFSSWVAILAIRSGMRRRWLWAIVALVGASQVGVDWTTGEVGSKWFTIQLLPFSMMRSSSATAWILMVAFPIGAIVVLERLRRFRLAAARPVPETADAETGIVAHPS